MSDNQSPNGKAQEERTELAALRLECERLARRVADLEKENYLLKADLGTFISKSDIRDLDMDMVLRAAVDKPSLEELIAELKHMEG
jgi:hypothetical protein